MRDVGSLLLWFAMVMAGCSCGSHHLSDLDSSNPGDASSDVSGDIERDAGSDADGVMALCVGGDVCTECFARPCLCEGGRVVCGRIFEACSHSEFEEACPPGVLAPDAGRPDAGDPRDCLHPGPECSAPGATDQACVPGGVFRMGDGARPDSAPEHDVFVSSFWMDRLEVTAGRYRACVGAVRCRLGDRSAAEDYLRNVSDDELPMVYLSFEQMEEFCAWDGGRLPTEAEWERAARGDDGRTYPWGEEIGCEYANWAGCVGEQTAPVGSYPLGVSPYGMFDMVGNVHEVTSDEWAPGGYNGYSPPLDVCDPAFPFRHMMLSGVGMRSCPPGTSFGLTETMELCTAAFRQRGGGGSSVVGFRCARDGN